MTDAPRYFSGKQRTALFMAAGGSCARCARPLPPGWHADHVQPYAAGGATDTLNGQALCPACNRAKGSVVQDPLPAWTIELRAWQRDCFAQFVSDPTRDFLCQATPGAGKTALAERVLHWAMQSGRVRRAIVVVPTDHLRRQWADDAATVGVQLDPDWTNQRGGLRADNHGICVTYQSVARTPDLYRMLCREPTLVVFDEIHHAGVNLSWGDGIRRAFEPAAMRLLLSGTPFRSDSNAIPYVRYDDGICRPHFAYSYADALRDGVCRSVVFPKYEGTMAWLTGARTFSGVRFGDDIPPEEAARRLRTALDVRGEWLRAVIADADQQLGAVRADMQPDAGGLIVCVDQEHAKAVARIVRDVTGELPTVAISEDPDASEKIKRFATAASRWLVTVRMVSEGVDIPRLYVGVFGTNVLTELFFRQVVGRFVRKVPEVEGQVAYLFLPAEEALIGFAERVKEERDHALADERLDEAQRPREPLMPGDAPSIEFFGPLASEAEAAGVVFDATRIGPELWSQARAWSAQVGFTDQESIVKVARLLALAGLVPPSVAQPMAPEAPAYVQHRRVRDRGTVRARHFAQALADLVACNPADAHRFVNARLKVLGGGRAPADLSLAQLERRDETIVRWQQDFHAASREGQGLAWASEWLQEAGY